MPVEIRELQITAVVQEAGGGKSSAKAATPSGSDDMITKCVEKVLEILQEKTER